MKYNFNRQKMEKTLKLTGEEAIKLYETSSKEWKEILENNFGKEFFSKKITDKIKTLTDVYNYLGIDRNSIIPFRNASTKQEKSINAFIDMQYISTVLNEGHKLDFENRNESKYYNWFERKGSSWCFGVCGVGSFSAFLGFGFYFKSAELAKYAASQFLDVYIDYLPE